MIAGLVEVFGLLGALLLILYGLRLGIKQKGKGVGRLLTTYLWLGVLLIAVCEAVSFTLRTYLPGH